MSGVELLMNNHQSLKAEIDAREDNIVVCLNLGKELLARDHYASNEVRVLYYFKVSMLEYFETKEINCSFFPPFE